MIPMVSIDTFGLIFIDVIDPSVKDFLFFIDSVVDPGEGVCADPVNEGAILRKGGPDPQGGNKERQLSSDKGREKM